MNTVTIYTNREDAEKLAVILLRSEAPYSVELCQDHDKGESGFLFTVSESEEEDWLKEAIYGNNQ